MCRLNTKGEFNVHPGGTNTKKILESCQFKSNILDTPQRMRVMLEEKQKLFDELKSARDIDVEVSLIHNFTLDLLGRDSHTAAIFRAKTKEE